MARGGKRMSNKPIVFNYQEYEKLKEELDRLRETAFWTDSSGKRDDDSEYSLYCSACKQWSEYRGNYCWICGRKMENPEVSYE